MPTSKLILAIAISALGGIHASVLASAPAAAASLECVAREVSWPSIGETRSWARREPLADWFEEPERGRFDQSWSMIRRLTAMSPALKARYWRAFAADLSIPGSERELLGLVLHQREAWDRALERWLKSGDKQEWLVDGMREVLVSAPRDLRAAMLKRCVARYADAGKGVRKPQPETMAEAEAFRPGLGPKRVIDALIRAWMPAEVDVAHAVAEGRSPLDGYRAHFAKIAKLFAGTGYGGYGVDEVMATLRKLRNEVSSPGFVPEGIDPNLFVIGSFVGGRARLGSSDIDLIGVSALHLDGKPLAVWEDSPIHRRQKGFEQTYLEEGALRSLAIRLGRAGRRITSAIRRCAGFSPCLKPSLHTGFSFSPEAGATVNPIQFVVGPDGIRMVVYQPFSINESDAQWFGAPRTTYLIEP